MTGSDAMDDEFDTGARWKADAVAELGRDHALPAACQGSGTPAALEWLGSVLDLKPRKSLLDVGAGLGGPAEMMTQRFGVSATLAEPEVGACRAARDLFARPVVAADGAALPFRDDAFDAVLSLGVLCTMDDKAPSLAEIRRVLAPGGSLGLLVFVKNVDILPEQPAGNRFPLEAEVIGLLHDQRFVVEHRASMEDCASPPAAWTAAAARVESLVERDHFRDDRWQRSQEQQEIMQRLVRDELVVGRLLACRTNISA